MRKKLIIVIGLLLIMCLLVPVSCAKAPTPVRAPPAPEVVITPPEPPIPPEPSFSIPVWARYTLIGVGGLVLFTIGYFMGRRSTIYW